MQPFDSRPLLGYRPVATGQDSVQPGRPVGGGPLAPGQFPAQGRSLRAQPIRLTDVLTVLLPQDVAIFQIALGDLGWPASSVSASDS